MDRSTKNSKTNLASCGCGPSCCGGEDVRNAAAASAATAASRAAQTPVDEAAADAVREKVRAGYGQIARSGGWSEAQIGASACSTAAPAKGASGCCGGSSAASAPSTKAGSGGAGGGCCGPATCSPEQLAAAIGYSQSDLAATPESAIMGLSCGNLTAIAALKPGEVVIDLGSGGGFDCFVAGPKVGATGRVIGIDMTPDMLSKARKNIASYTKQSGLSNVEFRLGRSRTSPWRMGRRTW